MQEVSHGQVVETNGEQEDFLTHLKAYGGGWFWDDIQTPTGTACLVEVMTNGTLTSVTDGLYMKHLYRNISDTGWIIQDRAPGKRVQGSLAK